MAEVERSRLITLPVCKRTLEVCRWSYPKLMLVSRYMNELYDTLPEDTKEALNHFYEKAQDRFFEVARMSVAPEHREALDAEINSKYGLDHDDAFFLIDTAFDLNKGGGLKKAAGLAGGFLLNKVAVDVQQESELKKQLPPEAAKK